MRHTPAILDVESTRLEEILRRAESALDAQDFATVRAIFEAYAYLAELVQDKNTSIRRLRQLLFGARTETTAAVVGHDPQKPGVPPPKAGADTAIAGDEPETDTPCASNRTPAARGHGRHGAEVYSGAERRAIPHPTLAAGDTCPACGQGTVYEKAPGVLVRITGQPPLAATVYVLQKLRCHLCGQVFTAAAPDDVSDPKYDATAGSMISLLKYGSGLPFNRIEGLQGQLGVPLPASTQWDIVHAVAATIAPAFEELIRQAAQGDVLHNDDTTVKILELMGPRGQPGAPVEAERDAGVADERRGLYTSGVVALRDGHRVALFFSGRRHAGENLAEVLKHRAAELPPPIQMCDALSRNFPSELRTILAHCLAHARRQFVDVYDRFPEPCRYLLESLAVVYHNDAIAREQSLSPEARLRFHQEKSRPTMDQLHAWLTRQLDEKWTEPNSALGRAIAYMLRHWDRLTLYSGPQILDHSARGYLLRSFPLQPLANPAQ
jgi:transposase